MRPFKTEVLFELKTSYLTPLKFVLDNTMAIMLPAGLYPTW
ncbi:hypothetical protein MHH52_21625 [Paenibacillus sp. FSL K6-0276]